MDGLGPQGGREIFGLEDNFHISNHGAGKVVQGMVGMFKTPFSCGVYALVSSCLIPFSAKYELKAVDVCSPPPSMCRILRDLPVSFSA